MSSFFNNYFFIILAIVAGMMMPTQAAINNKLAIFGRKPDFVGVYFVYRRNGRAFYLYFGDRNSARKSGRCEKRSGDCVDRRTFGRVFCAATVIARAAPRRRADVFV